MHGRKHLLPEDIQAVLPAVAAHRLSDAASHSAQNGYALVDKLLNDVDVIH